MNAAGPVGPGAYYFFGACKTQARCAWGVCKVQGALGWNATIDDVKIWDHMSSPKAARV